MDFPICFHDFPWFSPDFPINTSIFRGFPWFSQVFSITKNVRMVQAPRSAWALWLAWHAPFPGPLWPANGWFKAPFYAGFHGIEWDWFDWIYIYIHTILYIYITIIITTTSSTRTRRGGSCLKDIYKTFLIYRTCMRRAPAKPVRACTLRKLCPASHVTCEAPLRTSHSTLHTSHCTLRTPHFTLHTALFALQTSHSTLHTSHFSLHTSHSTLYTPRFTLLTAFFRLHTSYFTLYTSQSTLHTSHCFLHTPHTSSLHREAFTHSKLSHTASIYTQNTYTQCFYTWQALTHTHRNFYTEKLLHTVNFYTQQAFTHSKRLHTVLAHSAFTHGKRLHRTLTHSAFAHGKRLHTHKKKLLTETLLTHAQISFYTQQTFTRNIFYTQQAFTHSKRLDTEHLHTVLAHSAFTHGKRLHTNFSTQELQLQNRISTPKQKKDDFEALFKRDFKRKITSAKICEKSADKWLSQPGCSHSNTIYNLQLQKTIVLRMQPLHQATLTQPLQCDLRRLSCKIQ